MQSGGINLFSRKVAIRLQLELLSTKLAYQPGLRGGAAGWVPVGFLRLLLRTEPGGCVSGEECLSLSGGNWHVKVHNITMSKIYIIIPFNLIQFRYNEEAT